MNAAVRVVAQLTDKETAAYVATHAMRRSRARARARGDIMEALTQGAYMRAQASATNRIEIVGSARPSGTSSLLARAQMREQIYAELLENILPVAADGGTAEEVHRAVLAANQRIVELYVEETTR